MENRIIHSRLTLPYYITSELTLLDLFTQCYYLCDTNATFRFFKNQIVPIYLTFLFCLSLWAGQGMTTAIGQDQFSRNRISLGPTFFFQQSQIGYMIVQHTEMEIPYTYTVKIFSNFPLYFISYSPLVKQYSSEGDFEFFHSHVRLPGGLKNEK